MVHLDCLCVFTNIIQKQDLETPFLSGIFFTLEHLGDFSHDVKQCKLKVEKQKEKTKGSNGDFSQLHNMFFFHTPDKFVL